MAFDGVFLRLMSNELSDKLIGSRVDKIYMPEKNLLILSMRSRDFNGKLLLSCRPNGARMQITERTFENPDVPSMLCMLFRKRLIGAKVTSVLQMGLERIVKIGFSASNELGDDVELSIVCELMGRTSNIILCDSNDIVIDAVRRTDAADNVRVLFPGVKYTFPPSTEYVFDLSTFDNVTVINDSFIDTLVKENQNRPLAQVVRATFQGFSPLLSDEVAFRVANNAQTECKLLTPNQKEKLRDELINICKLINGEKPCACMLSDRSGKPVKFCFTELKQFSGFGKIEYFETLSRLLDVFYSESEEKARIHACSQDILKIITTASARISRRINHQKSDLSKAQNSEQLRIYGELLKGAVHSIKPGDAFCETTNYYSEQCEKIKIALDPALSPSQNAAKYFKEYRKAKTAARLLLGFIESGEKELVYLHSVFDELSRAQTQAELSQIRDELALAGYLRLQRGKKQVKQKTPQPDRFISDDGFEILCGKNNIQNDKLTLKDSNGNDMWFHAKDIPGAHVIVKCAGQDVPESTLTQAAKIAATMSNAGKSGTVTAIDYCRVKRVKKPSGAAPGMVIYTDYSTAYVTPDMELVERLRDEH